MSKSLYKCPNGCVVPPRRKELHKNDDNTYSFDYPNHPFCPVCGGLMPYALKSVKSFFDVYNIHPKLNKSLELIYKSEFESAVREAAITLENVLKKKSGLDLHGYDLATKALNFETDKKTGQIVRKPLIAINRLENESDYNEQKGVMYMLMGYFTAPRNLYLHNHIGSGVSNALSIVIETSFLLHLLDGHSITKNGHWITTKIDYREVYNNMPNMMDRWRLKRMLKMNYRKNNKKNDY